MTQASALYLGHIRHRRHGPRAHAFRYPLFMFYLDLDELPGLFGNRWFWSVNRRNIGEFRRSDYHGDPGEDLRESVRNTFARIAGTRPTGPIRLLTHIRQFGYAFNPVSFYYCFEPDGSTLHGILAEITNTPWKERRAYVLPVAQASHHHSALHWEFDKDFHVSPFLPMDLRYDWRFQAPDAHLRVHMDVRDADGPRFDATLVLDRQPLTAGNLARALLRFPVMSLKVMWSIHWQALRIWAKRNPVFDHPGNRKEAL